MYLKNYPGLQISFQSAFYSSVEVNGMSAEHKEVMCGHTIPFVLPQFMENISREQLVRMQLHRSD